MVAMDAAKEDSRMTNAIYSNNDTCLVKTGEIAVEFSEVIDGDVAPSNFCRFRSFSRALEFATKKRAEGFAVKAWRCLGDSSEKVSL